MKKVTTAFAAAGLLALGACGGGSKNEAANNSAEEVNVSADSLTATDTLDANAVGSDSNALGTDAGNLANVSDTNSTDAGNASANSSGNSQ